jgi:hypothetical protein
VASYEDLSPEHQAIFDELPGLGFFDDEEAGLVLDLYEAGFTHHSDEYGYDPDLVHAAREEFFEYTGLDYMDFDWDAWKEAMGYE